MSAPTAIRRLKTPWNSSTCGLKSRCRVKDSISGEALRQRRKRHRAQGERSAYFGAAIGERNVPLLARHELGTVARPGPLIMEEYDTTILVPPNCNARRDAWDNVVIAVGEEQS